MVKILKFLLFLVIALVVLYYFRSAFITRILPIFDNFSIIFLKSAPCREPIPYTLGTFDTRFNISKDYFLDTLEEAEMIWEKPFGGELFTFQEDAEGQDILKINLVYDFRQEATNKLKDLGLILKDNQASYDELKIKFTELKTEFSEAEINYNTRVQIFNERQKVYEGQVEYWNTRGGAPEKEYNKLQKEKSVLEAQFRELQVLQKEINEMIDEINAMVFVLNRLANTLNISAEKYNTIGGSRGESFTGGVYVSEGSKKEIDIYEFNSRVKLLRILAHELGHALDLPHVEDPDAIMYELNQGNSEILTEVDFHALQAKCGIKLDD